MFCGAPFPFRKWLTDNPLQPDNLLVHENGTLRISDFGCAVQFEGENKAKGIVTDTAGTMTFWAPECFNEGASSDVPM